MKGAWFWSSVGALALALVFVSSGAATTTKTITLTVNSKTDDPTLCTIAGTKSTGTCTLRGAVFTADAAAGQGEIFVIKLQAGKYALTGGSLLVVASNDITQIVGATTGKKKLPASTIDGSGNPAPSSVFLIATPLQISNVIVTGGTGYSGDAGNGGALYVESPSVNLENDVIKGSTACDGYTSGACTGTYGHGGGIYVYSGQYPTEHPVTLTLSKVTVTGNTAQQGGGIYNDAYNSSTLLIASSHIDKNVACKSFSNGKCLDTGFGGGIYNDGEQVTLDHSTVSGNKAGSPAFGSGGGGGIYSDNDNLQLLHSVVKGNVAGNYAGGIYEADSVSLVDSTVTGNLAGEQGGGIYDDYLDFSQSSKITGNKAGGTFECTVNGSTTSCASNTGKTAGTCATLYPTATDCSDNSGQGGGIYSDYEYPSLVSTVVSGNLAVSQAGYANCSGGQGGGIWTSWTLSVTGNSTITGNTADCGGGIYNNTPHSGGESWTMALYGSKLVKNTALEDGGGLWTMGPTGANLLHMTVTGNKAGRQTGGLWNDTLGTILLGSGNSIKKNTGTGACKNITVPCK